MIYDSNHSNPEKAYLVDLFNNRDRDAFGEVFNLYYRELYYYTSNLYKNSSVEAEDVIQDVFLSVWQSRKGKFNNLLEIKAYLFVSIKNHFKNYYAHNKLTHRMNKILSEDSDLFISQAVESEIFSIVPNFLNILPEECAKSFKLFIDGWEIKEIANELGKKRSTIYNQRQNSIKIIKEHLSKQFDFILLFFH